MFSRMCGTVVCGLILGYGAVNAQINLSSDQIIFRDANKKDKETTHYGQIHSYADISAGFFEAGMLGIQGFSTPSGSITNTSTYGGYFHALRNGISSNKCIGVYGLGEGGGTGYGAGVEAEANSWNSVALYAHGGLWAGYFQGNVYVSGTFSNPSDARFKSNETPLKNALDKILLLQPKTYFYDTVGYKAMNFPKTKQFGLIAQEMETIFPELVSDTKIILPSDSITVLDGKAKKRIPNPDKLGCAINPDSSYKAVNYMALIPVLVAAIQEQQKEIDIMKMQLGLK